MKKKKAKKKNNNFDILEFINSNYLLIIFCLLVGLVVFLGCKILLLEKDKDKVIEGDMLIPIIDDSFNYEFYIDSKALKEEKNGYVLRLCNYKDDTIISNDISYKIEVINDDELRLQVTKGNNIADLLSKGNIIEDSFKNKEKENHLFYIKLLDEKNISSDSKVLIKIYKA